MRFVAAYNLFGVVDNILISNLTFRNFNIPPIEDDLNENEFDGYANQFLFYNEYGSVMMSECHLENIHASKSTIIGSASGSTTLDSISIASSSADTLISIGQNYKRY